MNILDANRGNRSRVAGLLASVFCACLASAAIADSRPYRDDRTLMAESSRFVAIHRHDWSREKEIDALFSQLNRHDRFFSPANEFSTLVVESRPDGKVVFSSPVPALTYLWLSPDSKYLVGLSDIMLRNPYQIVVFTTEGKLIHREHVATMVARLTGEELKRFYARYPKAKAYIGPRVFEHNGGIYADYSILGMLNRIGLPAWRYLSARAVRHPYFPASETVTNFVLWYNTERPDLRVEKDTPDLLVLSLDGFDNRGRFSIEIPRRTRGRARP